MKKAALIVGARPQFIKTAPLVKGLRRSYKMILIHTGQHYDFEMSELFFDQLKLPRPDYHLDSAPGPDARQVSRMIAGLASVLDFERPDFCIVVGDTNSTLAGALASAKLGIPVVHVEAGLRSKNKYLPEQINRVVTDSVAECFLCPTPSAVNNLKREGKTDAIYDTGDIIYDCVRFFEKSLPGKSTTEMPVPDKFALATIHRAEAVDNAENLKLIIRSVGTTELPVILPLHPRTAKMINRFESTLDFPENITLSKPVGYIESLALLKKCEFVITDSGGVQREAAYFGKRVVLARPETEWLELVDSGLVDVAGFRFDLEGYTGSQVDVDLSRLFRPATEEMIEAIRRHY